MSNRETLTLQAKDTQVEGKDKGGRPSTYSPATAELICSRLAGGESLTKIVKTNGMPTRQTILRWRRQYPDFAAEYALARVDAMECMSDDILDIADDSTLDMVIKTDAKGREFEAVDHENINRDRLRVDTRKFLMSKIARHIYGERVDHEHSGSVNQVVTVELSDRERMRRLASFMLEDKRNGVTIESQAVGVKISPPLSDRASPQTAADIINGSKPQTNEE